MATPPTVVDAQRAADCLVQEHSVGRVLLFGSVARGEASEGSDIDLVALFDDLGDYRGRFALRCDLSNAASEASGYKSDVTVSDFSEWQHRTLRVPFSFEARIAADAVPLAGGAPQTQPVEKSIGHPSDNQEELINQLFFTVEKADRAARHTSSAAFEVNYYDPDLDPELQPAHLSDSGCCHLRRAGCLCAVSIKESVKLITLLLDPPWEVPEPPASLIGRVEEMPEPARSRCLNVPSELKPEVIRLRYSDDCCDWLRAVEARHPESAHPTPAEQLGLVMETVRWLEVTTTMLEHTRSAYEDNPAYPPLPDRLDMGLRVGVRALKEARDESLLAADNLDARIAYVEGLRGAGLGPLTAVRASEAADS